MRNRMLVTIGLKLLGVGKLLREFFIQNWKWLLPLILVLAGFLWTKEHYYNAGLQQERSVWEKKVDAERKRNQQLTQTLANSVDTFGKVVNTRNEERVNTEIIRENRINTLVQEKPIYTDCKVDKEVIDEQNAIKALGPKL